MRFLALLLALVPIVSAQEVFTPEHVAKIRTVIDAQISPNGEQIAYVLNVPRTPFKDDDGGAWTELHVVDLEGNSRPFVTGEVNVRGVTWRPNSSQILFLSRRDGDDATALYAISINGGEARKLFEHSTSIGGYDLDAAGEKLAFVAGDEAAEDRESLRNAGFTQKVFEEDWTPDKVWVADLTAKAPKAKALELDGSAHGAQWNHDGTRLAVSLAPTPFVDDSYMNLKLAYVDPENGEIHGGYNAARARWALSAGARTARAWPSSAQETAAIRWRGACW